MWDDSEPAPALHRPTVPEMSFEMAPRGGQNQLRNFLAQPGAQALMCAVVLAIHRNELGAGFSARAHHQFPPGNQYFFIGESDALLAANRLVGGLQAIDADDRRHHETRFWRRRGGNSRTRASR